MRYRRMVTVFYHFSHLFFKPSWLTLPGEPQPSLTGCSIWNCFLHSAQGCHLYGKQNPIGRDNSGKVRLSATLALAFANLLFNSCLSTLSTTVFFSHSYPICIESTLNPTPSPGIMHFKYFNLLQKIRYVHLVANAIL